jgi:hypothetical protein
VTLLCQWDGESFIPARRHAKDCAARLVVGSLYMVDAEEPRSEAAHRSFFASINEAWKSLPEDEAKRFPSADHLRRYALIKAGFCRRTDVVCANNTEAMRLAAMVKGLDTYSLTTVSERVVSTWTAESQSHKSMGKKRFTDSQNAVRDFVAGLLDVKASELPEVEAA